MRILVIEDEEAIADFIERGLCAGGYEVESTGDGADGLSRAMSEDVSLVVLDRMLPTLDGIEVLRRLRVSKPTLPVIMLSAKTDVSERVQGLDAGATDYIVKPFAFEELAARVRAHLRTPRASKLRAGDIEMDLLQRTVKRDGRIIHLSTTEFELLAYLVREAGQIVTRDQILAAVWGYEHEPGTNIVEVYMSYLRRKLAQSGRPAPIVTIRSVGYKLAVAQ